MRTALITPGVAAALTAADGGSDHHAATPHSVAPSPAAAPGKTFDVQMVGDAKGYGFVPANATGVVSAGLKPGICHDDGTPHVALGRQATVTVE